jgi:ribulose-phosphate 3-epimerase
MTAAGLAETFRAQLPGTETLRRRMPIVAPSMLKVDFGNLAREIQLLDDANSAVLHWDVMDGNFVPNLSYGAMVIASCRSRTNAIFEAHLMVSDPGPYIDEYVQAGCQWITVHIESQGHAKQHLRQIRSKGCLAGLCINPETPAEAIKPLLGEFDTVLVMSVKPGFGGQKFIPESLEKLKSVRRIVGSDTLIAVDGGIGSTTIGPCAAAGAEVFVAGSAVFDRPDYRQAVEELTDLARRKTPGLVES